VTGAWRAENPRTQLQSKIVVSLRSLRSDDSPQYGENGIGGVQYDMKGGKGVEGTHPPSVRSSPPRPLWERGVGG